MVEFIDFDDHHAMAAEYAASSLPAETQPTPTEQGTEAWFLERCCYISASCMSDMLAGGTGVTRNKYKVKLALERLTGKPAKEGFKNTHMERGNALEGEARELYSLLHDVDIGQVGFIKHPTVANYGASPDGIIGDDGLIEIKARDSHVHIEFLLSKKVPSEAILQMQAQMACTGRKWVDYACYNEDMPPRLRLFVVRVERDEEQIRVLEQSVIQFNDEIEALCERLRKI